MGPIAVTGPLGFLGRHFVARLLAHGYRCYLIDAETYAADLSLLTTWDDYLERGILKYVRADICTLTHLPDVEAVVNFAAETHVDNSLLDARRFVHTNMVGVHTLLELVRAKRNYEIPRFLQISTDEVYGSVPEGRTPEDAPLFPSSPYAASKAAADLLVQSYARTYGVPYNIVRPSNCYGLGQYPEKLIPKATRYFAQGKAVPVHDTGQHTRTWLDARDCAAAVELVLEKGASDTIYNVGGNTEASISHIVNTIATAFDKPQVKLEYKRAGVDARYCVDDTRLRALGWQPLGDLFRDLPLLVEEERSSWRW